MYLLRIVQSATGTAEVVVCLHQRCRQQDVLAAYFHASCIRHVWGGKRVEEQALALKVKHLSRFQRQLVDQGWDAQGFVQLGQQAFRADWGDASPEDERGEEEVEDDDEEEEEEEEESVPVRRRSARERSARRSY
jgi:hypothetical protein